MSSEEVLIPPQHPQNAVSLPALGFWLEPPHLLHIMRFLVDIDTLAESDSHCANTTHYLAVFPPTLEITPFSIETVIVGDTPTRPNTSTAIYARLRTIYSAPNGLIANNTRTNGIFSNRARLASDLTNTTGANLPESADPKD